MNTKALFLKEFRKRGFRVTPIRRALLSILMAGRHPFTIKELGLRLKALGFRPHKTTLYREIEFLSQNRWVQAVDFSEGGRRYEWQKPHHHHLVCRRCQRAEEIDVPGLETAFSAFEGALRRLSSFAELTHSLEFFGLCARCGN